RGLFSGFLGILLSMPGLSPATGEPRLTFGFAELLGGFELLAVLLGLFAISQMVYDALGLESPVKEAELSRRGLLFGLNDLKRHWINLLRSSVIGTWIGILPGVGANVGSVLAYSAARSASKQPEEFGDGSEDGIVASESANNATVGGALIPLVALGIPGSVIDAILLGALVLHGLQPGPLLFEQSPDAVHTILATVLLSNIFMYGLLVAAVPWIARLIHIPKALLLPALLTFCVLGSFALSNRAFDVWVMLGFGALGVILRALKIPLAPFVIGFVLAPVAEENLSSGLQLSGGSFAPLVTRPISCGFLIVAAAVLGRSLWRSTLQRSTH
ncbi:MAG: tripartite tricarboxylate transporter permease, partial [Planctomycetota bacterium]